MSSTEQEAAAAKLQAVSRGKKARFDSAAQQEAATKIQSLKRGNDSRKYPSTDAPKHPAALTKGGPGGSSSRRVSFSGKAGQDALSAAGYVGSGPSSCVELLRVCLVAALPCAYDKSRRGSLPKDATNIPLPDVEPRVSARNADSKDEAGVQLSASMLEKVKTLFEKLDADGSGTVTKAKAQAFWQKNWSKVNATAMFNEVDDDGNGKVTYDEWLDFWRNVIAQPEYEEEEVIDELENMISGGSWVDWNDGRMT